MLGHTATLAGEPAGRVIVRWGQTAMQAVTPDGEADWISFPPVGDNLIMMPGIAPDGVIYSAGWSGLRLWATNG